MRKITAKMMAFLMDGVERNLDPLIPDVRVLDDGVVRHRNLTYFEGGHRRDAVRYLLDLYLPAENLWGDARSIVMFIHGGGWRIGSKDDLYGLYGRIGQIFAKRGIAFAAVNYRLTPRVQHPEHIYDVARAFAFLHERAMGFGYSDESIFLMGHSAGAHLASLLALNIGYLESFGLDRANAVRGVIAMSGLYDLRGIDRFLPVALEDSATVSHAARHPLGKAGLAFPSDSLADASPILHIGATAPPFLLVCEESGEFMVDDTNRFASALAEAGVAHTVMMMPGSNHISMLVNLARSGNVTLDQIVGFVGDRG